MERADTRALAAMMNSAADAVIAAEPQLTRLDSAIGDGDHGIGMKTGFTALKRELSAACPETPHALLHACGLCLVKSMGGSSGVLFGTLLLGGLEAAEGRDSLSAQDLFRWLCGGIQGVMRRGRARAGDKTMADALLPAQARMEEALERGCGPAALLRAAEAGARAGAEATRGMLPRLGRAKNFREAALGLPDPGAVSVSVLFGGMAAGLEQEF